MGKGKKIYHIHFVSKPNKRQVILNRRRREIEGKKKEIKYKEQIKYISEITQRRESPAGAQTAAD